MKIPSEGCWKDENGTVIRHAEGDHGLPFEFWASGQWRGTVTPGAYVWTPCEDPSAPEWRNDHHSRLWALENQDKHLVTNRGYVWRFNSKKLLFEVEGDGGWIPFSGEISSIAQDERCSESRPEKGTW